MARATPVGTSHKFQGRQFDTVLADLVEDGHGRIFTANLRGGDYSAESVRLFNVAATRARSRLYILVSRRALERAGNGPLAAVRSMVSSGQARRVNADSLLGMFGIESPAPGTPEADLVAALPLMFGSRESMTRTPLSTRSLPGSMRRVRASGAGVPGSAGMPKASLTPSTARTGGESQYT